MNNSYNEFNGLNTIDLLKKLVEHYPTGVSLSNSLGLEDMVLFDMIDRYQLPIRVFTLDTGRLFPESYDLINTIKLRYQTPIQLYFPDYRKLESMVNTYGINLFYESQENRKLCCFHRKVEPLNRALYNQKVWVTGLRASQSENRKDLHAVTWDENYRLLKVNPLINWSLEEIWEYIRFHKVSYHSLHNVSYPSIGCQPCTRAIEEGEDIRAGRWWWEQGKKECGLHLE